MGCQCCPAAIPVQQRKPHAFLQRIHGMCDRRRCDVQQFRRPGHVFLLCNGAKNLISG